MTDKDLTAPEAVERLASRYEGTECEYGCGTMKFCVCAYAADCVDTLRALSAALEAEKEKSANLGRELNAARYGQPDFAWSVHIAAMDELKAELAEAVETLKTYACKCEPGPNHECAGGDIADCGYRARAFLARHQKG